MNDKQAAKDIADLLEIGWNKIWESEDDSTVLLESKEIVRRYTATMKPSLWRKLRAGSGQADELFNLQRAISARRLMDNPELKKEIQSVPCGGKCCQVLKPQAWEL